MSIGIIYNIFVCLVSGFTSFTIFLFLRKLRKDKKVDYTENIDYFALLLGLIWILVGIRNLFTLFGYTEFNFLILRWFAGPLIYLHLLPAFYYFGWSFFKTKKKVLFAFNGFFTLMVILAILTFLRYGIIEMDVTYWGAKHKPNEITNKIFIFGLFIPIIPCILVEFFRRLNDWRKTKTVVDKQLFGFSLGFLIYAVTGAFETLIFSQNWMILLARIMIMLAPLTLYISATWVEN